MAQETKYSKNLLFWVQSQLNILIGADDFAPLLISLNDEELQDYCNNLLGENTTTQSFVNELIAKRNDEKRLIPNQNNKKSQKQQSNKNKNKNKRNHKKNKSNRNQNQNQKQTPKKDSHLVMSMDPNEYYSSQKKSSFTQPRKNNASIQSNSSSKKQSVVQSSYRQGGAMTITHAPISKKGSRSGSGSSKKKNVIKRPHCGCQATLHEVFKNCTECGYILCEIEGEGPCYYCSAFVTLAGAVPNISRDALSFDPNSESYKKAVAQKDKLLQFGREKAERTTIIDDQGDFYENEANNLWLTKKQREWAKQKAMEEEKKLNESRADKAVEISIDFGSGRINEIDDGKKKYIFESVDREKLLKEKIKKRKEEEIQKKKEKQMQNSNTSSSYYQNSSLTGHASKVYASIQKMMDEEKKKQQQQIEEERKNKKNKRNKHKNKSNKNEKDEEKKDDKNTNKKTNKLKNQYMEEANSDMDDSDDEEKKNAIKYLSRKENKNVRKKLKKRSKYKDSSDLGVCLSMHQPWASLLVLGIKKVEGRSWMTGYRGRLWIASARREPTPFEIEEVEEQYCAVYNLPRDKIPFPKEYPTTALLGCVDMVDCLTREEYQKQFIHTGLSTENNSSDHCFICENPRKLILPGAISGEHKLWKMPVERIKPMQSGLIPCDLTWIPDIESRQTKP